MDGRTAARGAQDRVSGQQVVTEQVSQEHVGRWNRLISTTNWEKGRIILEWRTELAAADAPSHEYTDEAWSQRVGGVSSQHVGRLRRVCERFAAVRDSYTGLFWSHFQAALDWEDAEMWLEGAVQSDWSVAQMRRQRWETLGGQPAEEPREADIVAADFDEDVDQTIEGPLGALAESVAGDADAAEDEVVDDANRLLDESHDGPVPFDASAAEYPTGEVAERPFANLAPLPDDLAEAFEAFKLAIVRHRLDGWRDVSRDDVLHALDALKALALSAGAGDA